LPRRLADDDAERARAGSSGWLWLKVQVDAHAGLAGTLRSRSAILLFERLGTIGALALAWDVVTEVPCVAR